MRPRDDKARSEARMTVSPNGRYLLDPLGKPFFWLGDTAWLLFQKTTREQADLYLRTRAEQGFTLIQAALVMGEERVGGTLVPNAYGRLAFLDGDAARPDVTPGSSPADPAEYDYWDHADSIVDTAAAYGLVLGLLPSFVGWRGEGYKHVTPSSAYAYGRFLGERYRTKANVVWVLGGDNTPDTEEKRTIWRLVARGIAEGATGAEDYARIVMTYHINAWKSTSGWLHAEPWMSLNMIQTWDDYPLIPRLVIADYHLSERRPTVLAEGAYEDGPQYPTRPIGAHVIRKQAYWSYFAGGGHTYGNTNVWNFGTFQDEATEDWVTALRSPGASSLTVLRRFFDSLEWWRLAPDQSMFAAGVGSGRGFNAALRSPEGDVAVVYLSEPTTVSLRMERVASTPVVATWIDPRTGERTEAGRYPSSGVCSFSTPTGLEDALLLLYTDTG